VSSLRELQLRLFQALRDPKGTGACEGLVRGKGPVAAERLAVHRNHFLLSLTDALRVTFPVVLRLVGDDFFRMLARRFVREKPPTAGHLTCFGGHFPAFLDRQEEVAPLPWLPDVAAVEWLQQEAFHAAEAPVLDLRTLAAVPDHAAESLRLVPHPSVRLLRSAFPCVRIWETNHRDSEPAVVDLRSGGETALVWRSLRGVEVERLSAGTAELVTRLQQGECFAAACEAAVGADPFFDAGAALADLCRSGALSAAQWTGGRNTHTA